MFYYVKNTLVMKMQDVTNKCRNMTVKWNLMRDFIIQQVEIFGTNLNGQMFDLFKSSLFIVQFEFDFNPYYY